MGNHPIKRREQVKHKNWKKLGFEINQEIGALEFEKIWMNYYDSSKNSISVSQALKFLRHLTTACEFEWEEDIALEMISKIEKDKNELLTYEEFKELFFVVSELLNISLSTPFRESRHLPKYRKVDVYLSVYDLQENLTQLNNFSLHMGFGAFHTGVEIFDTEISYCEGTGIHQCSPKGSHIGEYRDSILMGQAQISPSDVIEIINEMSKDYTGDNYDLFEHNCNHFCDDLCLKLVHNHIPGPITKLTKFTRYFKGFITLTGSGSLSGPTPNSLQQQNTEDSVAQIVSLIIEDDVQKKEKKKQSLEQWIQAAQQFKEWNEKQEQQIDDAKLALRISNTNSPKWTWSTPSPPPPKMESLKSTPRKSSLEKNQGKFSQKSKNLSNTDERESPRTSSSRKSKSKVILTKLAPPKPEDDYGVQSAPVSSRVSKSTVNSKKNEQEENQKFPAKSTGKQEEVQIPPVSFMKTDTPVQLHSARHRNRTPSSRVKSNKRTKSQSPRQANTLQSRKGSKTGRDPKSNRTEESIALFGGLSHSSDPAPPKMEQKNTLKEKRSYSVKGKRGESHLMNQGSPVEPLEMNFKDRVRKVSSDRMLVSPQISSALHTNPKLISRTEPSWKLNQLAQEEKRKKAQEMETFKKQQKIQAIARAATNSGNPSVSAQVLSENRQFSSSHPPCLTPSHSSSVMPTVPKLVLNSPFMAQEIDNS